LFAASASESSAGAEAFVNRFSRGAAELGYHVMDIWRETLPEFDGDALEAKYARQRRAGIQRRPA